MKTGEKTTGHSHTSFYPAVIPPEVGHPTTADFEVVGSAGACGRRLRARRAFRCGERVARVSGILACRSSLDTIQILPELHLHDRWFCRLLMHSCEPNLAIDTGTMELRAVRDIAPRDWLTIDYAATEDVLDRQFACQCGSARCRGWVTGRREEPNADGRAWLAKHAAGNSRGDSLT